MKSVLNPCSIAAVIGFVMLFCGIHIPSLINEFLTYIGDVTIPLSMIVVGVQLGGSRMREILHNGRLIAISLLSLIGLPFIVFLAVNWLPIYTIAKLILIYGSAFPSAVVIVALAAQEGRNANLAAEGVALTTLLSMATLPIVTVLLSAYYGM